MPLNYATVTGTFDDGQGQPVTGSATFTPSAALYASGVPVVTPDSPVQAQILSGQLLNAAGGPLQLLATDNTGITIEGQTAFWFWTVKIQIGGTSAEPWSFFLPHAPSPVDLFSLSGGASGGGFTSPMTTLGDMIYESAAPAAARLPGNATAASEFLNSTGSGGLATAPAWKAIAPADLPAATTAAQGAVLLPQGQFDITAAAYGARGDGKAVFDLVLNGTTTATSASAGFTSADTGKTILIAGGAGSHVPLVTTITFVSATTVTLGTAAGATGSGFPAIYGTDDTAAINAAYAAALAWGQAHGQAAVITGPPLIYMLAAATTKVISGGLHFNAQIPLTGNSGGAGQKFTPVFKFAGGVAAPIFSQAVPQAAGGATFVSALTGQTVDGTFGAPSVIGGPTDGTESTSPATWANITPVIDGLTIVVPLNPTVIGLDFRGCAGQSVIAYSYLAFDTIANIAAVAPTHSWATGLFSPVELSNDESFTGQVCAYGAYYGAAIYAHASAQTIKAINCGIGLFIGGNGNDKHGLAVNYISAEGCGTAIQVDGNSGITIPVHIGMLDAESVGNFGGFGSRHIDDPNNGLGGRILINDNSGDGTVLSVNGAANCEIIAASQARGFVTPPAVPLTTVALKNPRWRHATVYITSGGAAVSAIAVGGTVTGLTLGASGTVAVRVPAGATVTLTYASTAPT